jgi:hypothetical protein
MPIADFDTGFWTIPWIRKLDVNTKLVYIYLWTNNHKSLAGIYPIDLETIAFETGLAVPEVKNSLARLAPRVHYDFDKEIVFVVNHVKRQFLKRGNISPKVVIGIEKALISLPKGHHFISDFLSEYHGFLDIGYPYPFDTVSGYPPGAGKGKGKGLDKGIQKKRYRNHVLLTDEEHDLLVHHFGVDRTNDMIKELNRQIAGSGKEYDSHYSEIMSWSDW